MSTQEEQYKEELKANGVELPEENKTPEEIEKAEAEAKVEADAKAKEEAEAKAKADPEAHLQDPPKEPRKRSIYDEYKDVKHDKKELEKENGKLKARVEAFEKAKTPEAKKEAKDDLEAFAEEINASPEVIKKMRDIFLKDLKPQPDESLKKDIEEFKEWKAKNQQAIEKQAFEEEFESTIPTLKELFPGAKDEEIKAIKKELDKMSHTKEYHDKSLDYVAFKNKETLSALVSPKKKGMETKERKEIESDTFDFDPNADFSKLSPAEQEKWLEQYNKMTEKPQGLTTDASGKKILI